jgi:carboxymethylenebutenolidase
MNGRSVSFQSNGQTFQGYLSTAQPNGAGVIVIQEWWGLVDHIRDLCDRFASEGFNALAPDLYKGQKTKSPDEAGKLLMALNIAEAESILRGAIDALLADPSCSSKTVGVVGFCMGGQLALYAAATNPETVSACVDYYGIHPNVHPPLENLKAPVLGFFAETDTYVNSKVVESLRQRLSQLKKPHEFHTYAGTHHAFFNDTHADTHDAEASRDTWQRMLAFFRRHVN